ncbi:hypothetical protein KPB2_5532 [Klebsiella pneumoniae Kb677]|nr:hypothetical protein KPB2_5532 [Klebsiella pneumoniae Kb677]
MKSRSKCRPMPGPSHCIVLFSPSQTYSLIDWSQSARKRKGQLWGSAWPRRGILMTSDRNS